MAKWLSGLLGAGFDLLGKGIDYKYQSKLANQQFDYQQQLQSDQYGYQQQLAASQFDYQQQLAAGQFDYQHQLQNSQNQYNMDMWNLNNEYNSPAAQAKRLSDAGFNPSISMGNSVASSASVSSSPSFSMPTSVSPTGPNASFSTPTSGAPTFQNLVGMIDALSSLELKQAQVNNLESSSRSIDVTTDLDKARLEYQKVINSWSDLSEHKRLEQLQASINNLEKSSDLSDAKAKEVRENLPYIAKLSESQIRQLQAQSKLAIEEAVTEVSKRNNLDANSRLALQQAVYYQYAGLDMQASATLKDAMTNTESYKVEDLIQSAQKSYYEAVDKKIIANLHEHGIDFNSSTVGNILPLLEMLSREGEPVGSGGLRSPKFGTDVEAPKSVLGGLLRKLVGDYVTGVKSPSASSHRNPQMKGFQMGK